MRTIIERVTCDRCGQMFDFEKFSEASMTARIESLTQWLNDLGWATSNGLRLGDFCPCCSNLKKGKSSGEEKSSSRSRCPER